MTMSADKALRCVACGAEFVFTVREQEFHAAKGFTNEPRRCQSCRQARRSSGDRERAPLRPQRDQATARAAGGTEPAPEGARTGASATRDERRTFAATCSACGGEAILPYEPVGNRPVLCSGCYDKIRTPA